MAKKKKRKHNPNLIRLRHSYTLAEIAEVYNIHIGTVRGWRKQGLIAIDETSKPYLVIGAEIRRFIKDKAQKRQHPLKDDEFYCPKCKVPRKSLAKHISIKLTGKMLGKRYKQALIEGICEVCNQLLLRFSSDRQVQEFREKGLFLQEQGIVLIGSEDSSLNTDIERSKNNENKY